ncbi:MAG: hypothetical protein IPM54_19915 [Polyangiaceae bacterium]|nr:hypothetical protein [Polyangiaceae bacterium]
MVNIWKVSTLVFAGAFAFVVGRGAIAESIACNDAAEVPTTAQSTRLHLVRGLAFLDSAEKEVQAATGAPAKPRADALAHIAKARAAIGLALNPKPEPQIIVPRPRPKIKIPKPKKPVTAGSGATASTSSDLINPFLRPSTPVQPAVVKDPWAGRR